MARILVIDDDADIRSVITHGVAQAHQIATATNGVEAIALTERGDDLATLRIVGRNLGVAGRF